MYQSITEILGSQWMGLKDFDTANFMKEEGRRKKEEGRRKKEEGRRKKEEGRRKG
jgi:hypothetical protein